MTLNPFSGVLDRFFGRGRYSVTVPSMDGALQPNRLLELATPLLQDSGADNLVSCAGVLFFTVGRAIWRLAPGAKAELHHPLPDVACALAASPSGQLAVALQSGRVLVFRKQVPAQLSAAEQRGLRCITAIDFVGEDQIVIANGSATRTQAQWQTDLLERNSSGSIWKLKLKGDSIEQIAGGLAHPAGVLAAGNTVVVSEAWKHRVVTISLSDGKRTPQVADLPGYPGRLARCEDGSAWLCVFAPRSQLIEFVLREDKYRAEMLKTIPPEFWVAPAYRSGRSFEEPLQGGAVKQMGMLKPWAPTRSYGLLVKLDDRLQPEASFHSRSDGDRHGITSVAGLGQGVVFASRGAGGLFVLDDKVQAGAVDAIAVH